MKRIFPLILTMVMLASTIPAAHAVVWLGCQNCDNPTTICPDCNSDTYCPDCDICWDCGYETPAKNTNDHTAGTLVVFEATGSESYTITVPAKLAPGQGGSVVLAGTWADNRVVTVTADENVTLVNSILESDTKTLKVTFDGISEAGDNTTAQTFTETISVAGIENALFGTWSGKFNYNVETVADSTAEDKNEYGIYLNVPYVGHLNSRYTEDNLTNPSAFIFYKDGSVKNLQNGIERSFPAGSITEETLAAMGLTVNNDGEEIFFNNRTYTMYSMENLEIQDLECRYNGYNVIDLYVTPNVGIMREVDIEIIEGPQDGLTFFTEYDENGNPIWLANDWAFDESAVPGTYTVKVTVEDYFGNILTDTITFDVEN